MYWGHGELTKMKLHFRCFTSRKGSTKGGGIAAFLNAAKLCWVFGVLSGRPARNKRETIIYDMPGCLSFCRKRSTGWTAWVWRRKLEENMISCLKPNLKISRFYFGQFQWVGQGKKSCVRGFTGSWSLQRKAAAWTSANTGTIAEVQFKSDIHASQAKISEQSVEDGHRNFTLMIFFLYGLFLALRCINC